MKAKKKRRLDRGSCTVIIKRLREIIGAERLDTPTGVYWAVRMSEALRRGHLVEIRLVKGRPEMKVWSD